jgi:hypothetical protein
LVFPCLAACQTAILHIHVVEGDGGVHVAGSRNSQPLVVEVTDETNKPVEHAAVSFHLPSDGPGGVFPNGLRTEVGITAANGRASIRSVQWNRIPGRFQIRIVASFEQSRAGVTSSQYIDGPQVAAARPGQPAPKAGSGHSRWWLLGVAVAGGAVAGVLAGHRSGGGTTAAATPPAPPPVTVTTVGAPVITVLKP